MLAIRVELLTGRYVATAYNDRQAPEWPPHPARLFSALVATWAEIDVGDAAARSALEWLEAQAPPAIAASGASPRTVVPHFVPVNDTSVLRSTDTQRERVEAAEAAVAEALAAVGSATGARDVAAAERKLARRRGALARARAAHDEAIAAAIAPDVSASKEALKAARALLPESRGRQPRHFPSVTPDDPVVHFVWEAEPAAEVAAALARLLGAVTRLGHSSTLVSCSLVTSAPAAAWRPEVGGDIVLRAPGPGGLRRLVEAFERHRAVEPRVLPCQFVRYGAHRAESRPAPAASPFADEWIVFRRVDGPRLPATRAVDVATAVRGALMKHADQPPAEVLSGHRADGSPAERPHLAVVPLPFVGHRHADGAVLGVALVLPRACDDEERGAVLRAVGRWEESHRRDDEECPIVPVILGATGVLQVERVSWGPPPARTLRAETWCRPSRRWISATPVALDRNPGDLRARSHEKAEAAFREAERTIAESCANLGLPVPIVVVVFPSVTMPGTWKAREFPPFPAGAGRIRRVKVHVSLEFDRAVRGPILLGAGRYLGLGLFCPVGEEE